MKIFIIISICLSLNAKIIEFSMHNNLTQKNKSSAIKILDVKELIFENVNELSALAYKDNNLYALSNLAYLHKFSIDIKNNKINSLKLLSTVKLKNKKSHELKNKKSDSEGMVLVGSKLYISFERKPRVDIFSLNGKKIKKYKIQKKLKNIDNYRGKNKALESITYLKKIGIVVAPEVALEKEDENYHYIYSKNKFYKFKASAKLSALESIDDYTLLSLERYYNFFSSRRIITLKKIYLKNCKNDICKSDVLAILDSDNGWNLDNFEGLTKISKNRYLMVSDDNQNIFQKTLLVLFEIK